ncbi:MAG: pantetheine-phosphate adenylyltransferase [Thermoplasmata archaeon]
MAVLGGTFDRLHVGHHALLAAAFDAASEVGIGVTTDDFLAHHPKPQRTAIRPFRTRLRALRRYLARTFPRRTYWVAPLSDPFGRSVEPGVNLLVVSSETVGGGRRVNAERRRRGLPPLPLRRVPLVRAEDGQPVSSRRIRSGAIDAFGRRRRPLTISVRLVGPSIEPNRARAWARTLFPCLPMRVRVVAIPSRPPGVRLTTVVRALPPKEDEVVLALAAAGPGVWEIAVRTVGASRVRAVRRPTRHDGRLPSVRDLVR